MVADMKFPFKHRKLNLEFRIRVNPRSKLEWDQRFTYHIIKSLMEL